MVGVLEKTGSVLDRLVLTSIESVWQVHEEHQGPEDDADRKALEEAREVTVVLVQYASPLAAAMLPRQINSQSELQAASPAYETARLFRIVGVGVEALRAFALVLILAAGLSVFIALYTALEERRYDLAVMRTLGASPRQALRPAADRGRGACAARARCSASASATLLASALGAWLESQQQYPVTGLEWRPEELWLARRGPRGGAAGGAATGLARLSHRCIADTGAGVGYAKHEDQRSLRRRRCSSPSPAVAQHQAPPGADPNQFKPLPERKRRGVLEDCSRRSSW